MARRLSFSSSFFPPSPSSFSSSSSSSSGGDGGSRRDRTTAASADAIAGFKPYVPSLRTSSSSWSRNDIGGDRFIPVRLAGSRPNLSIKKKAAADDDDAEAVAAASTSPSRLAYRRALADTVLRDRVLTFSIRPVARPGPLEEELQPVTKQRTRRWRLPKAPSMALSIPGMQDDLYLNLLDWGSDNVLAIGHGRTVDLWDDSKKSASRLASFGCPVNSLGWAPDGRHIAVGPVSSCQLAQLQLWNAVSGRMLRGLSDLHFGSRVTSLAWKDDNVLATGGCDGDILLLDLRLESPVVQTFHGHDGDVCALKWSGSGRHIASGGDVDLLHIWDVSMAASTARRNPWLYRMHDHKSTVKALAWCPFQSDLLASGGSSDDCCIKLWNTSTGRLLNSVDTGDSEVCSLQWSVHERRLISSHGGPGNQLSVWMYPSMAKVGELMGHQDRALFTAQSPDGYTLASASPDEYLIFWQFSGDFQVPKPKLPKPNTGPFSGCSFSHIR